MPVDLKERARGCLMGLAVGDALGGPTEGKSRVAITRLWGRVSGFLTEAQQGSDDTEHALFNARLVLRYGLAITSEDVADAWLQEIAGANNAFKGAGFSEMLAIRNLRAGLRAPESGRHCHAWSDGLAMRVAPFGIVAAGRPSLAAELAETDGLVTNAGEGIHAGKAVAAAVAQAMGGAEFLSCIDAGRDAVPQDSWTRRSIDRAVEAGLASMDVWSALAALEERVVSRAYTWPDLGPEAVALAFGLIAAAHGDLRMCLMGAINIGRDADTIAAIAGAITGAALGFRAIPPEWVTRIGPAAGTCIAAVKGMRIEETADALVAVALQSEVSP
jgi:ADP-ribosylglycohydrolase